MSRDDKFIGLEIYPQLPRAEDGSGENCKGVSGSIVGEESISQLHFGDGTQPKHSSEIEYAFKQVGFMLYKQHLNKTVKDRKFGAGEMA